MKFTVTILCLLLVPSVLAATIATDIHFESPSIDARNYTKANTPFVANLVFTKNAAYGNLLLTPGTLNDRNEANIPVPSAVCIDNLCTVPVGINIPATKGTTYKDVQFTLTAIGGETQTINQRFYIDTIAPVLTSIGTPTCKTKCAVKTGTNTVVAYFTEEGAGMDAAATYVLAPTPVRADSCTKNTCSFTVTYTSQAQLALKLASAKDTSANAADVSSEYLFTIDNNAPVITSISSAQGKGAVVTGPFTLRVAFSDETPVAATAQVGTEAALALTCTESLCTGRIVPPSGADKIPVKVVVTDSAGNSKAQTMEFTVARSSSEENEFWSAQATAAPSVIDKATLNHFKKTIYLRTTLEPAADQEIASMQLVGCKFTAEKPVTRTGSEGATVTTQSGGVTLPLEATRIMGDTTPTPTIMITIGATPALNDITGELNVICDVNVYTVSNGVLYERAQKVSVTSPVNIIKNKLINERITERQAKLDAQLAESTQQLALFRQTYQLGAAMCNAIAGIRSVEASTTATQGGLASVPLLGEGLAIPARVTHEALYTSGKALLDNPVGGVLCSAATCEYAKKLNNGLFAGDNKFGEFSKAYSGVVTGNNQPMFLDPHKSWIVAYGTACIPEIIYHTEVQHSIDCTYASCVRTQTPIGVPLSACDAQKSNLECRYKYAGAFYLTPAALAQQLRDHIISMVASPMALIGYVAVIPCKPLSNQLNAYCELPFIVEDVYKAVATVQQLQSYAQLVAPSQNGDACAPTQSVGGDVAAEMFYNSACNSQYCSYGGCVKANGKYYNIQNREKEIAKGTTKYEKQKGETDFTQEARVLYGHTLVEGECSDIARANVDRLTAVNDLDPKTGTYTDILTKASAAVQQKQKALDEVTADYEALVTAKKQFDDGSYKKSQCGTKCTAEGATRTDADYASTLIASATPQHVSEEAKKKIASAQEKFNEEKKKIDPNSKDAAKQLNAAVTKYANQAQKIVAAEQNKKSEEKRKAEKAKDKEIRQQVRAAERQKMAESTTYTLTQAAKTAHMLADVGVRFTQVASRFGFNVPKWVGGYSESIDNSKLGKATDFEEEFLTRMCEDNMVRREPGIIGIDAKQSTGLYIQGSRSQVTVPGEDEDTLMYQYVVSGVFALPSTPQTPATVMYSVQLDGGPILDEGELAAGSRIQWRAPDFLSYEDANRYEKVCITLNHSFGDIYQTTSYDGDSRVCVQLISTSEVASS